MLLQHPVTLVQTLTAFLVGSLRPSLTSLQLSDSCSHIALLWILIARQASPQLGPTVPRSPDVPLRRQKISVPRLPSLFCFTGKQTA